MPKVPVSKNIKISPSYKRKSNVRQKLQDVIVDKIRKGEINDDAGIQEYLSDLHSSLEYLKTLKFDTYMKLIGET